MTAEIDIPPAALEAGKDTAFAWLRSHMEDDVRVQNMTDEELGELVEAACIAMLAAWPGMAVNDGCPVWHAYPHIILSLKENTNDKT